MDHKTALQQAVAEIFENMAFQELTPIPQNPLPAPVLWSFRQATMTIYSPIQGTLVMTISPTCESSFGFAFASAVAVFAASVVVAVPFDAGAS